MSMFYHYDMRNRAVRICNVVATPDNSGLQCNSNLYNFNMTRKRAIYVYITDTSDIVSSSNHLIAFVTITYTKSSGNHQAKRKSKEEKPNVPLITFVIFELSSRGARGAACRLQVLRTSHCVGVSWVLLCFICLVYAQCSASSLCRAMDSVTFLSLLPFWSLPAFFHVHVLIVLLVILSSSSFGLVIRHANSKSTGIVLSIVNTHMNNSPICTWVDPRQHGGRLSPMW
jgi:hypothetical protein